MNQCVQVDAAPGATHSLVRLTSTSRPVVRARRKVVAWFKRRRWTPFRFQRQAWNAYLAGESGLIHATTGTGKTYAAWMGPVIEALAEQQSRASTCEVSA